MSCVACPRKLSGWFYACLAAAALLDAVILAFAIALSDLDQLLSRTFSMIVIGLPWTMIVTCAFTGLPASLVIWISERLHIRSVLFYGPAGAGVGALIWALMFKFVQSFGAMFVLAGCLAGIVYWLVAGQHAGEEAR
jgi:hypothetical protein